MKTSTAKTEPRSSGQLRKAVFGGSLQSITFAGSFTDWSGEQLLHSDPQDIPASVNSANFHVANDASYLYIRFGLHATGDPSLVLNKLFVDADNNAATGFDVAGGGHVGSGMLIQSGAGYQQKNGGFNEGGINGLDWLSVPGSPGTDFELRISRNATNVLGNQTVFANNTISGSGQFGRAIPDHGVNTPFTFAIWLQNCGVVPLSNLPFVGGGKRGVRFSRIFARFRGVGLHLCCRGGTFNPVAAGAWRSVHSREDRPPPLPFHWHPLTRYFWQTYQSSHSSKKSRPSQKTAIL